MKVSILTGPVGAGKTTLLRSLVEVLARRKIPVSGFTGPRVFEGGELDGYDLVEASGGRRVPFLRRRGDTLQDRIGPWFVDRGGRSAAAEWIRLSSPASVLAVDELGPLELTGGGHWPAVRDVLDGDGRRFVFVIRDSCLEDFRVRFAGWPLLVFSVDETLNAEKIIREIAPHDR